VCPEYPGFSRQTNYDSFGGDISGFGKIQFHNVENFDGVMLACRYRYVPETLVVYLQDSNSSSFLLRPDCKGFMLFTNTDMVLQKGPGFIKTDISNAAPAAQRCLYTRTAVVSHWLEDVRRIIEGNIQMRAEVNDEVMTGVFSTTSLGRKFGFVPGQLVSAHPQKIAARAF
jgi:hypothetical protein